MITGGGGGNGEGEPDATPPLPTGDGAGDVPVEVGLEVEVEVEAVEASCRNLQLAPLRQRPDWKNKQTLADAGLCTPDGLGCGELTALLILPGLGIVTSVKTAGEMSLVCVVSVLTSITISTI